MSKFKAIWLPIILIFILWAACAHAPEKREKVYWGRQAFLNLEREIERAARLAGGVVGVSALHLETGREIGFNAQERFPMASVYKIPIAVQLLYLIDKGKISLDMMVDLKPGDLRLGSGIIAPYLNNPGLILSVRNLLELMLVVSDNTATDILLRLAGGPEAVTGRMRALGIIDMDINRPTINLIAEASGFTLPPEKEWNLELLKKLSEEVTPETRQEALEKFVKDWRDTSTPEAMVKLLQKISRGNFLKEESKNLLLNIMERCVTGRSRIKGILLPGISVAHKTGTIAGVTNDAGIITLPDEAGQVAMAIFIKSSEKDLATRELAIAQISRAIYDFFLFNPSPPLPKN